jgi:DNA-binding NarL/FixJ family response regulator
MTDAERRAVLEPRLYDVARMVADGYNDKQITATLRISRKTLHLRITAISYLVHADQSRNVRTQIGRWWESHDRDTRNAA